MSTNNKDLEYIFQYLLRYILVPKSVRIELQYISRSNMAFWFIFYPTISKQLNYLMRKRWYKIGTEIEADKGLSNDVCKGWEMSKPPLQAYSE